MENVYDESMDISKLKVPDLKRELKARGLTATGNKNELMERLQAVLKNKTDDSAGAESVDDLEEDLLNVDDDEHLDGSESGITDIDTNMEITPGQKLHKRKSHEALQSEPPKLPKKVILNRTSSHTDVTPNSPLSDHADEIDQREQIKMDDKKVIKLSELSAKDRLEMRARKFGMPITGDAKKAARAERFGTINSNLSKNISLNNSTTVDVLKQRAERFGSNVSSVITKLDNEERIKRRQERFGGTITETAAQSVKTKETITTA